MLSAGICTFQDREGLKRALDSLVSFDLVIVIDGAFECFASENRLSNDGTDELCAQYKNVKLYDRPDRGEHENRAEYLRIAELAGAKHLLVIDSDEYLTGDVAEFKKNLPTETGIYSIDFFDINAGGHSPAARLITNPQHYDYHLAHCLMKRLDTGEIFRIKPTGAIIPGITMHHDITLRSPDRQREGDASQERMKIYEHPIKERYQAGPR